MDHDDLPIVDAMIHYLYHGTYDDQVALEREVSDEDVPDVLEDNELLPSPPTPEPVEIIEIVPEPVPGFDEPPMEPLVIGDVVEVEAEAPSFDDWGRSIRETQRFRQPFQTGFGQSPPPEILPEVTPIISTPSALLFNAKVYIIADKYMIPGLKELANEQCVKSVKEHWNTPEFSEAAELLWENTAESDKLSRDAVVTAAATHIDGLLDRGEFVAFMSTHGDFAVEVMKRTRGLLDLNMFGGFGSGSTKKKKKSRGLF